MLIKNRQTIVVDIGENGVVLGVEQEPSEWVECGEDVTSRGGVFAAVKPRTELTNREQEINIIRADEILRQIHDRAHQRRLAVVIRRQLGHGTGELRDFNLFDEISLETREHDLALAGLEAVDERGNGTLVVQVGEEHELFVHELGVVDRARVLLVEVVLGSVVLAARATLLHVAREPVFALLDEATREGQLNRQIVARTRVLELDAVTLKVTKVLFRFLRGRSAQTFIVSDNNTTFSFYLILNLLFLFNSELNIQLIKMIKKINKK